ncbi:rhomboid family intramembrane serine protease [Emticicia sp. BO119]|uniref:rhomboid family intramembrane serine protease n=1 Tax=Emticicia sp. BO119 TaxID=2757768 RepID=UPI0015F05C94|nr:rhomboid family intramembrane serine protease [Emticicia sp. BO119]MBA4853698.1 rhomboid family intramembrane serine protease [Emticicia sp. BO119]
MFYLSPVARNLLIANVVIFILTYYLIPSYLTIQFAFFNPILPGSPELLNPNFKIWQPFTYMFMHGDWGHIISNMFALLIFGSGIETFFGSKRFLIYYLVTGIGASFIYSFVNMYDMIQFSPDSEVYSILAKTPMVGASGAVFGILIAYAYLFPNNELIIFPFPIPVKAKYLVAFYGLYELYSGIRGTEIGIAHFAHVGGLLIGFILLRYFGFGRTRY